MEALIEILDSLRRIEDKVDALADRVNHVAGAAVTTSNEVLQLREHVMRDVDRLGQRVAHLERKPSSPAMPAVGNGGG